MNDIASETLAIIVIFLSGVVVGSLIGIEGGSADDLRSGAIEAGVARYAVDEKTGEVKFVWIVPK